MKKVFGLLKKDGSFLMEAMIGTAILSIVMVFFATVCISAFMLMQRAYQESKISEEVFMKVESHRYSELEQPVEKKKSASGIMLKMKNMENPGSVSDVYVTYKTADGTDGFLTSVDMVDIDITQATEIQGEIYTYKYQGGKGDSLATFYLLKGAK